MARQSVSASRRDHTRLPTDEDDVPVGNDETSENDTQQYDTAVSSESSSAAIATNANTITTAAPATDPDPDPATIATSSSTNSNAISNIPSLVCAFSASATTGGTSYAFSLYSAALKHTLHLTQTQLDTISTTFFVAGLFSWIPGLVSDRFGTRVGLALGGTTGATSLLLYWVVARQWLFVPHDSLVPVLSTLGVGIFLSNALVTGAVFKILSTACTSHTGSAVGAAKGYVGLGAGLYAGLYAAARSPHESDLDFLAMAAVLALTCSTTAAVVLLPTRTELAERGYRDDATPRHYRTLFGSLLVMAGVIVVQSLYQLVLEARGEESGTESGIDEVLLGEEHLLTNGNSTSATSTQLSATSLLDVSTNDLGATPSSFGHYGMGLVLMMLWLGPIYSLLCLPKQRHEYAEGIVRYSDTGQEDDDEEDVAAASSSPKDANNGNTEDSGHGDLSNGTNPDEACGLLVAGGGTARTTNSQANGTDTTQLEEFNNADLEGPYVVKELNLYQMLQTPSALLMLWTTTILVGAGTVITNNCGQMTEALGFSNAVTSASLALFSVAQAAGRVLTGFMSENALAYKTLTFPHGLPRPFFLVLASLLTVGAHGILSLATNEVAFVVGAALSGYAFGMVWPLLVLISKEVFGTANVGANYMFFDGFTSAAGTLLLTKWIAQDVYESHIVDSHNDHDDRNTTCVGMGCFASTHYIVAVLSLTCVFSSLGMLYTSRHIYSRMLQQQQQQQR